MKRIMISRLEESIGEKIFIQGWVHRVRILKNISFVIVRDRSGMVQCVVDKDIDLNNLTNESVVEITGVAKDGKNSLNNFEVIVEEINVINKVEEILPIEVNKNALDISLETLLNNRVLSLRNEKNNAIFKVQHILLQGFREFLSKEDFTEIFSPKIVAEGAEGGTSVFKLNYFGKEAYLSQSPQFYKQMMIAAGYERVFEIGNFFRAEDHDTRRHLNQFTSMDVELAFIEDENSIMDIEENLLKYMFNKLVNEGERYIKLLNIDVPQIDIIPRIEFKEALKILKENYGKIINDIDLDSEGEELISKYAKEKFNSDFIFITNYYREKRPMYTMPKGNEGTKSFDLIFRGMEITSGGQRIDDYSMLIGSFTAKGLDPGDFKSYIDIFKYGVPPHGGFAIGLERFLALLLGFSNVRETTLFPRDKSRLVP